MITEQVTANGREREQEWYIFTQSREDVVAALKEGRCEGIFPAAHSFMDGFAEFCLEAGVLEAFSPFPSSGSSLPSEPKDCHAATLSLGYRKSHVCVAYAR